MKIRFIRPPLFFLSALSVAAVNVDSAQPYPLKPLRFIVPYAAGGTADTVARIIAQKLTDGLGQPVVVDNRPGAEANAGTGLAAKAAPDGYTIVLGTSDTLAINPSVHDKLAYDAVKSFAPVSLVATLPMLLVVHPSLPVKSVNELIVFAKNRQRELTYGSPGIGSTPHLAGAMFAATVGIQMRHVPYNGDAAALDALLGERISLLFEPAVAVLQHVNARKLKALAITSRQRSPLLAEAPTLGESGLEAFEAVAWYGVLAPAGTSSRIVARLNAEITRALHMPDVKNRFLAQGATPVGSDPAHFAKFIDEEIVRWAKAVEVSGAKIRE
jgi:tripartite-type tricarboxylate transporter receptor subunit TctC